jgi:hypothetical protein
VKERLNLAVFFVLLAIPCILFVFCWIAWKRRVYLSQKRRKFARLGLIFGSYAALSVLILPISMAVLIHGQEGIRQMAMSGWFISALASCPVAMVLLGFGMGMERWLGICSAAICFVVDICLSLAGNY